jgi:hypothetical protein
VQGKCTYESTGAEGCCQPTIFFDDFSTDKGWEYGPEWERGSATASVGQSYNGPDPSSDHTSSDDNMIAGVVIGGNEAQSIHEYYYLTSPIIDLSYSAAPLLVFWRWLNSDYLPYMQNVVEVFAGKSWVKLWETGGSPGVADAAWTFIQYDVAAYANPEFRVRFGFRIGSGGVFAVSSWNVDDVMIWDQGIGGAPMCCQYDSQCEGLFKPAACVAGGCQK